MSRINILVYCHIYDNKYLDKINISHPPVYLFLFNESKNEYDKIELNKKNLDKLKQDENIHITFIDESAKLDQYGYQKNDISQLVEEHFDYIFPINCPFTAQEGILKLLKHTGQYLYNNYSTWEDDYKDRGIEKSVFKEMIKEDREKVRAHFKNNPLVIEFNDYKTEHRPFVFKSDIDSGLGWYVTYTRADIPKKSPPKHSVPESATATRRGESEGKSSHKGKSSRKGKSSTAKCSHSGCTVSGGKKRTKRSREPGFPLKLIR